MSPDRIRHLTALRQFVRGTEPNMPLQLAGETSDVIAMWVHVKGGLLVAVPSALAALLTGAGPGLGLSALLYAAGSVANASHVSYLRRRI
ncbi:hypothetical protein ACIQOV_01005 [Kitasatospora sp. NPDC091257]|uniref:hypothetical protein n=2 Tax=unclassified Kitasatospora TaxID=2633591 RepID=UPI003826E012